VEAEVMPWKHLKVYQALALVSGGAYANEGKRLLLEYLDECFGAPAQSVGLASGGGGGGGGSDDFDGALPGLGPSLVRALSLPPTAPKLGRQVSMAGRTVGSHWDPVVFLVLSRLAQLELAAAAAKVFLWT
jgi:hypothetical protein